MDTRWTELLNDLRSRFTSETDVVEVEAWLSSQGYDRRQIGEILALLYSDSLPSDSAAALKVDHRTVPFRVQGPHERGRFSPEAWGYLMKLSGSGSLSLQDFEQLVERALMHIDGRVGLNEIRALAEEGGFDDGFSNSDRFPAH